MTNYKILTACGWCGREWMRRSGQTGSPCCSTSCRTATVAFAAGKVADSWPRHRQAPRKHVTTRCKIYYFECNWCRRLRVAKVPQRHTCPGRCSDARRSMKVTFPLCSSCGAVFCSRAGRSHRCYPCQSLHEWKCKRLAQVRTARVSKLLPYIGYRDKWKCQICRQRVKSQVYVRGDNFSPTIDHVIPQSQGGTDDPSNLRLAHMICNSLRQDYGGNEQLLLVG